MKRYMTYIIILMLIATISNGINAQSVKELEDNFSTLSIILSNEGNKLDSLKGKLNIQVNKINDEKEQKNPDKNKIKSLMASSVVISNEVDEQQKKVDNLKDKMDSMKKLLVEKYSVIVDSLNTLLKKDENVKDKEELKSEIFYFTEKRLKMYPAVKLLSFHPDKILQINMNEIKDTTEKKLYKEYLDNALDEVDNRLTGVTNKSDQISQMLNLQEKAKRFLEEAEFGGSIRPKSFAAQTSPSGLGTGTNYAGGVSREASKTSIMLQVQYYTLLLNQLDISTVMGSKSARQFSPDPSVKTGITMEQYQKLLLEVKKRLQDYKTVLMHKLGKTK